MTEDCFDGDWLTNLLTVARMGGTHFFLRTFASGSREDRTSLFDNHVFWMRLESSGSAKTLKDYVKLENERMESEIRKVLYLVKIAGSSVLMEPKARVFDKTLASAFFGAAAEQRGGGLVSIRKKSVGGIGLVVTVFVHPMLGWAFAFLTGFELRVEFLGTSASKEFIKKSKQYRARGKRLLSHEEVGLVAKFLDWVAILPGG
jgi:hypothetical protein